MNVGCYGPNSNCADVFTGQKLSSIQCGNPLPDFTCNYGCIGSLIFFFESTSGMTVEKCLQKCTANSFKYAEITSG